VRRFWLSDVSAARDSGRYWNGVADLATRLAGSNDIVNGPFGPLGSVNFITAHDGFTLKDLVSYNVKHNQVNGESNRDGSSNNNSFNHGYEGETNDPSIRAARRKAARNLMATLLFSAGIPMVTAGDERGKSQLGNNNAYCQDSPLSWVNWELSRTQQDVEATFAFLTKMRREHPALRPKTFGSFDSLEPGRDRIRWFNAHGHLMTIEDWDNPEVRSVARYTEHDNGDGSFDRMLLVIHGAEVETKFVLPLEVEDKTFELLWDSALETPPHHTEKHPPLGSLLLTGTSMQLFSVY
jgi:glycogen operon protein